MGIVPPNAFAEAQGDVPPREGDITPGRRRPDSRLIPDGYADRPGYATRKWPRRYKAGSGNANSWHPAHASADAKRASRDTRCGAEGGALRGAPSTPSP